MTEVMWWHLKVRGERVSVLTIEEQSLLVIRVVQTAGFLCFFFFDMANVHKVMGVWLREMGSSLRSYFR